jgi:hypothetical protein
VTTMSRKFRDGFGGERSESACHRKRQHLVLQAYWPIISYAMALSLAATTLTFLLIESTFVAMLLDCPYPSVVPLPFLVATGPSSISHRLLRNLLCFGAVSCCDSGSYSRVVVVLVLTLALYFSHW